MERLPGIGPRRAAALRAAGLGRVLDLLLVLPRGFQDRCEPEMPEAAARRRSPSAVVGRVRSVRLRRLGGRRSVVVAVLDGSGGAVARAVWFNQPWRARQLAAGEEVLLYGTVRPGRDGVPELVQPELDRPGTAGGLVPEYGATAGIGPRLWRRLVTAALPAVDRLQDPLPAWLREELGTGTLGELVAAAHGAAAGDPVTAGEALRRRLALDELLALGGRARLARRAAGRGRAPRCRVDRRVRELVRRALPFQLTPGQRRAVREVVAGLEGDRPMARLLQGDVGSGKTVVAAVAAVVAAANGLQVAFMAPTELLVRQHAATLTRLLEPAGVRVVAVTGSAGAEARRTARRAAATGAPAVFVGTHALLAQGLDLPGLGLVVIDEQHRFGVAHRAALVGKGRSPHLIVMSATPIPRTLALLVYADLDLSVIRDRPPGRRAVRTVVREERCRPGVLRFVQARLAAGERAFVVFPRIEPGPSGGGPALLELEEMYRRAFHPYRCETVHGGMAPEERAAALERFRTGAAAAVLATTVVEVGVDVPEATVMVVEGAERFGLAQLHQLRGRVGRAGGAAWCVLLAGEGAGEGAWRRLHLLARCDDGFELAERDLAWRGPGDPGGRRQWGGPGLRHAGGRLDADTVAAVRRALRQLEAAGALEEVTQALERTHGLGASEAALRAG